MVLDQETKTQLKQYLELLEGEVVVKMHIIMAKIGRFFSNSNGKHS
jgi:alkyl hydroperoxide reductase subunit AhpF